MTAPGTAQETGNDAEVGRDRADGPVIRPPDAAGRAGNGKTKRSQVEAERTRRGAVAHLGGQAAESAVAAHYRRRGRQVLAERWRGQGGEIDIVVRDGRELVFVEVKKSHSIAAAAQRVSPRQIERLFAAAAEYLSGEPAGQLTPMRFDVALVDGLGRVEVLENALSA